MTGLKDLYLLQQKISSTNFQNYKLHLKDKILLLEN